MKVKLEIDSNLEDCEVIIRCPRITEDVTQLSQFLTEAACSNQQIVYYQKEKEYYFPIKEILFFESCEGSVLAHTVNDIFTVKYRLYELEERLPAYFMRVSKSTILNTREIYSITKNLTSSSVVEFQNTHKKVYVSRNYYKPLAEAILHRQ